MSRIVSRWLDTPHITDRMSLFRFPWQEKNLDILLIKTSCKKITSCFRDVLFCCCHTFLIQTSVKWTQEAWSNKKSKQWNILRHLLCDIIHIATYTIFAKRVRVTRKGVCFVSKFVVNYSLWVTQLLLNCMSVC